MKSITAFIRDNADQLAAKVREKMKPLHDPATDPLHPSLQWLLRKPKKRQDHLITGNVKALHRQRDVIWGNSPGTGKTYCSIATTHCYANGKPYTCLVVCPPHLVGKWEREIKETIPGVVVIQLEDWQQWMMLSKATRSLVTAPTWFVTPISKAKLGAAWRPAFIKSKITGVLTCPDCARAIYKKKHELADVEWLSKGKRFCEHCKSALWQECGAHKIAPSKVVKKWMKRSGFWDMVILDECFIGSALVLMSDHQYKRIDSILPGESVLSWDGANYVSRTVTRTIKIKRRKQLVRVRHSAGECVCTIDHKFFTQRGYVKAKDLSTEDNLLEGMPALQGSVCCKEQEEVPAVLQHEVLCCVPMGESKIQGDDDKEGEGKGCNRRDEREVVAEYEEAKSGQNSEGEDSGNNKGKAICWDKRREWESEYVRTEPRSCIKVCTRSGEYRMLSRMPEPLQIGHSEPIPEDCHRSRREESLDKEGSGSRQEERGISEDDWLGSNQGEKCGGGECTFAVRIESVEFLRDEEAIEHKYVYDLEVEGTHCYFASDVLVSNCHQLKGNDTLAGESMHDFVEASAKCQLLTGTLIAGKADDLRPTYFRLLPSRFIKRGFKWNDNGKFSEKYGKIETTVIEKTQANGRSSSRTTRKIRPGIMPNLFGDFVADRTVFLSLEDMGEDLPEYKELTVPIAMPMSLAAEYGKMAKILIEKYQDLCKSENPELGLKFLPTIAEVLLTYPDDPSGWGEICYRDEDKVLVPVYAPKDFDWTLMPKEQAIVEAIEENLKQGRQSWVFSTRHATTDRLLNILRTRFNVGHLTTSVPTSKREEWIAREGPKVEVMVSHPKLVETGVELFGKGYNFSAIEWFATGYELNVIRQASARAWRLTQTQMCSTRYFYYENTAQEKVIKYMAKKLLAAEFIEGSLSAEGLMAEAEEARIELAIIKQLAESLTTEEAA